MRQACFVLLVLASLGALAQTPPASKAPKAGGPVFVDFGAAAVIAPASNAAPAEVHGPKSEAQRPTSNVGGQGASITATSRTTIAGAGSNAVAVASFNPSGYVPDDKYKLRVGTKSVSRYSRTGMRRKAWS